MKTTILKEVNGVTLMERASRKITDYIIKCARTTVVSKTPEGAMTMFKKLAYPIQSIRKKVKHDQSFAGTV